MPAEGVLTLEECALRPHPFYPLPSPSVLDSDPEGVRAYLNERAFAIYQEETDPYRYGYSPEVWSKVDYWIAQGKREALILGGNRATKSYYAGHRVVQTLMGGPRRTVWCLQTTYKNSVEMQQPIVYRYLPLELKNAPRTRITNISFSQKLGFSDGKFVLPNGSECVFRNYSQKIEVVEGGDCDAIWADELVPLAWIETLRYRLLSRKGLLLMTFTPTQHWSPTVSEYLENAKTIEFAPAPLLPRGMRGARNRQVPRVQQPVRKNAVVVYFHTADNPFTSEETTSETLDGAPVEEILVRAYGVPSRLTTCRFPRFRESVHLVPQSEIPTRGTNYHFVDPASGRNWFMLWVRVTEDGTHYVYREWPCPGHYIPGVGDPGEWATADGKLADGRQGPAQVTYGWGIRRYLEEIERLETLEHPTAGKPDPTKEEIAGRWMDSAFGRLPNQTADSSTTLLEECLVLGLPFSPAPHEHIDEGVSLINNLLDFERDEENQISRKPKLIISQECRNTIFSLKLWNGADGRMGATKDPIDTLRYMACARLVYFEDSDLNLYAGGCY